MKRIRIFCVLFIISTLFFAYYTYQNFLLTSQNKEQSELLVLSEENQLKLNKQLKELESETETENKKLETENKILQKDNQKLNSLLNFFISENNSLRETLTIAYQTGIDRPKKFSFTPKVVISRGGDRKDREDLIDLSKGSFTKEPQTINYQVNEILGWHNLGKLYVTRYTATKKESGNDAGYTSDGKLISLGFSIAVDTKYWDYGTIFYIEGLGFAIASDTGSGIKGPNHIDFSVTSMLFSSAIEDDYRQVWLIYQP